MSVEQRLGRSKYSCGNYSRKNKNNKDLKRVLQLRDCEGKSRVFQSATEIFHNETSCKEAERLLLETGSVDYKGLDRKEHSPKFGTLWDNLISDQQQKLKMFLDAVGKAQDRSTRTSYKRSYRVWSKA